MKLTPETIPQELIDILDRAAGREHSRTGTVVGTLAEILTAWERLRSRLPVEIRDVNGVLLKLKSSHQCRLCGRWLEGEWANADAAGQVGLCVALRRQMDNGRCDPGGCRNHHSRPLSEPEAAQPPVVGTGGPPEAPGGSQGVSGEGR